MHYLPAPHIDRLPAPTALRNAPGALHPCGHRAPSLEDSCGRVGGGGQAFLKLPRQLGLEPLPSAQRSRPPAQLTTHCTSKHPGCRWRLTVTLCPLQSVHSALCFQNKETSVRDLLQSKPNKLPVKNYSGMFAYQTAPPPPHIFPISSPGLTLSHDAGKDKAGPGHLPAPSTAQLHLRVTALSRAGTEKQLSTESRALWESRGGGSTPDRPGDRQGHLG